MSWVIWPSWSWWSASAEAARPSCAVRAGARWRRASCGMAASRLVCGGNDNISVSGVTANFNAGSAIHAGANCHVRCTDCTLSAPVAIEAGGNAEVVIINGSVKGTTLLADASGNAHVTVTGNVTVAGASKQSGNAAVSAPSAPAAQPPRPQNLPLPPRLRPRRRRGSPQNPKPPSPPARFPRSSSDRRRTSRSTRRPPPRRRHRRHRRRPRLPSSRARAWSSALRSSPESRSRPPSPSRPSRLVLRRRPRRRRGVRLPSVASLSVVPSLDAAPWCHLPLRRPSW